MLAILERYEDRMAEFGDVLGVVEIVHMVAEEMDLTISEVWEAIGDV